MAGKYSIKYRNETIVSMVHPPNEWIIACSIFMEVDQEIADLKAKALRMAKDLISLSDSCLFVLTVEEQKAVNKAQQFIKEVEE